jgi:dolichyl-phosphate-mannose--protein O-mannosyl transferase
MKPNKLINKFFFIPNIIYVLIAGFLFRILISNFGTLQLDHGTFVAWGASLASGGFKNFYTGWSDYLPGYLYILWILGKINLLLPSFQTITFKIPAIMADVATGYLIYNILKNTKGKKWAEIGAIIYIFNPAIFANSSLWGQVDSITSFFSLLSLYLFPSNYLLSAVSLAVGTLTKPQAAFILPAVFYLFIKHKKSFIDLVKYGITGLAVFIIGFAPFTNQPNLFYFILDRLTVSSGQYPYGSVNAFSFWGLFGFWKPDALILTSAIITSVVIVIVATIVVLVKKPKNGEYILSFISLLTTFLFLTRIHERHLLPVLAPLLIISFDSPVLFLSYIGLSATYLANLYYAYVWIVNSFKEIFGPFLIKIFIVLNISSLPLVFITLFKKINIKFKLNFMKSQKQQLIQFSRKDISLKKAKVILLCIIVFSFVSRIYSLGTIKEMYFDEIYHAFTAKLVLHNDPKAWEFWNPNPEGFAYEWTHPPISKLGMVLGMTIFGENSFGWRFPQAVMGVMAIYLIYLITKFIFEDRLLALLSAFVFSLDGLPLVLSRMGMNDSYVLFFSLLSVYLFLKDKNFWSAFAFGLAIASKWSGIYTIPVIFVSHFVFKRKTKSLFSGIKPSYFSFLLIPVAVYVLSYGVMFSTGHTWQNFVDTQKQMWWYHTGLVATHPYTSPAWSWPLLLRPIYLYDGPQQVITGENTVARIYAFGNPVVFWFGLFSVIVSLFISYKERNKKLGFIAFSYLVFFLPWIASPRIMFLYHYLPSIPFLAISSGYILRRYPKLAGLYILLAVATFIYFYPHWAGLRIPEWLDTSYYWFTSWR